MGFHNTEDTDIYKNITEKKEHQTNQNWTLFLFLCVLTVTSASFQFGYNISSLNPPTDILKEFIGNNTYIFEQYHIEKSKFDNLIQNEINLLDEGNLTTYFPNVSLILKNNSEGSEVYFLSTHFLNDENYFKIILKHDSIKTSANLNDSQIEKMINLQDEVKSMVKFLWTTINCLFVIGGMIGAFTSKFVLDILGRKRGILFHNLFSISGSVLVLISSSSKSPICLVISRFLFGIQGGMSCSLIPTYLSEISPAALRGQTGVAHQLCLTFGILVAQILGFKEILGTDTTWNYLLAFPLIPSILGSIFLAICFPESPKALISKRLTEEAESALMRLRSRNNVNYELQEIFKETSSENGNQQGVSFGELFSSQKYRWPLITALVLQMAQQLCGINAVFFYSNSIFKNAGISGDMIQYAVLSTGVVNFLSTILCTMLIDKLGRKPLLLYPMILIIIDFILLTIFLYIKGPVFSYLSIVCIMVFIVCFAVGLGPIPFIYAAECFGQEARGAALAICMLTNWIANLFLTLCFPILADLISNNVFIIFCVIVFISVIIIMKKVPETKGKSLEEILIKLNGRNYMSETGNNLLMTEVKA
ncbi:unnamed protein product [Brachionus calyciflorus]|uniref:Major facilitator superfamily (MFS) profile domain-containing protein n=1 Tax=Brachionus calyciflorus TaxID=104777 RepID=A0A813XTQ9_9BILA|nr:unnamed protein product [Brachionus calyciflorus]